MQRKKKTQVFITIIKILSKIRKLFFSSDDSEDSQDTVEQILKCIIENEGGDGSLFFSAGFTIALVVVLNVLHHGFAVFVL